VCRKTLLLDTVGKGVKEGAALYILIIPFPIWGRGCRGWGHHYLTGNEADRETANYNQIYTQYNGLSCSPGFTILAG
jgi:hypothetical protein